MDLDRKKLHIGIQGIANPFAAWKTSKKTKVMTYAPY